MDSASGDEGTLTGFWPGHAHMQFVALEPGDDLAGRIRQQRRIRIDGIGAEPGGREFGQPAIEQRTRDDIDGRPAIVAAHAEREMQRLDIFGELLLERERHGLQQLGAGASRQVGVERDHLRTRHDQRDAPRSSERSGLGRSAGLRRHDQMAHRIDDHPRGLTEVRLGGESNEQPLTHELFRKAAQHDAHPGGAACGTFVVQETVQGELCSAKYW